MPIIQVEALTKQFQRRKKEPGFWGTLDSLLRPSYEVKTAVDKVSFQIEAGEIIGYIGPNGAGKSTTIKILSGILTPTAGKVSVLGLDPSAQRKVHVRNIGVVFGQRASLWWDVPVADSLRLLRDIYKVPEDRYRQNLERYTALLELGEFLNVPVRQLSLGQRVRADIAAALMHDPSILFLDEPTIGVDVISKERLRNFIKEVNAERQVTILLTTHDMNEIEKLCRRVLIIDNGRILYDGSLEAIRSLYSSEKILAVEFEEAVPDFELPGAQLRRSEERKKWFAFKRTEVSASSLIQTLSERYALADLNVEDVEIEEVVRAIYLDQAARVREG